MLAKAIILIGGPQKGTRFRPLSMELAKPLFPLAGVPMLQHHIDACKKVPNIRQIFLMGFYDESEFATFMTQCISPDEGIQISYLRETQALGTGGGLMRYRDIILEGQPDILFVLHGDVCSSFPLNDMLAEHQKRAVTDHFTLMATQVERERAHLYGCVVENPETGEVLHYAEKPQTFVSDLISCGVFIFTPKLFDHINALSGPPALDLDCVDDEEADPRNSHNVSLERDVLVQLSGSGKLFVYKTLDFWTAVKTSGSALHANRCYLSFVRKSNPERLVAAKPAGSGFPTIVGDVIIDPTATVDPTCKLGPNVTIGPGAKIGAGVRIVDSIVLDQVEVKPHACIIHAVIGWQSIVGAWSRVEGVPGLPGTGNQYVNGQKNNGVTILGKGVEVAAEIIVRNCIVLPHKSLTSNQRNEILL
ncbi:mannose-1-phosphate guanylyltransferase [Capsaspora owczarzaki ATCC 30864]|uniref:Mannose-1-phosphate guanylyltransferase n=1 Tax=Capsaspora owczarzaki (strain ATCC 30864) TaxID=595528 RepID=A0A0D2W1K4_CAPO3|nr:mannose-1-phosphate guanylyltransferase [Capsaspora owczarzaki ATCC 30864]KJE98192.1 mannose-1-phosphate guanylyltransferase [Capsaspora owczarzaki ATCC 30864]|eukprot:XP_004342795.1 mannose-1-phosphate guanylyltransferase [Capsaspora owczarzaki ATCC 30864]